MMLIKLFLFFLVLLILPDMYIYKAIYAVFPKNGHIGPIGFPVCFFYWE